MCRILAFHVKGELDKQVLEAIKLSAEHDNLSIYGGHPDGWGIVALIRNGDDLSSFYYRSSKPIFKDDFFNLIHLDGDEVIGILHVRKAGKSFLLGLPHAHPYHTRANGYDIFFAHNGSVNRKAFRDPLRPYTDSYMVLEDIADYVNSGLEPYEAFKEEYSRIKDFSSSLNSALLYVKGKQTRLIVLHSFNPNAMKEKSEQYYHIYCNENYCMSSSVAMHLPDHKLDRVPIGFKEL
ncbi:class II glutamine amidotransferase [Sulfuracidifex tepidarius]|uniref:Glutamine amidotransferase type-2 domain-containing protein n=1 Tax=Sulfuracidifex tepidarius TaxID=1294262 RepID=A0A510E4U1_9CREN|nr:class II glutamine amidotransferase [Sulfuracidifex tepidarius]BBG24708.1 hypothetical protein IC006_2042 [Sulfuracidifex tepidarius]BBG27496.1 hypothetical protein IC007_2050 [Sulfuracidifex tepidarius]